MPTKKRNTLFTNRSPRKKQVTFLKQELNTAKKNLKVIQTSFATQDTLYQKRLVAESTYLSVVRELNEQQGKVDSLGIKILQAKELIIEYEIRLQSVISTAKSQALQQLGVIKAEKAETVELYEKIEMQVQRLAVKSPLDSIVKGLNINTVGGVIAPGSQLIEIVPTSGDLLAEIKVSPNYIGHSENHLIRFC